MLYYPHCDCDTGVVHDEIDEMWQAHLREKSSIENIYKQSLIQQLLNQLRDCVATLWPFSRVEVFGSIATGTARVETECFY